MAVSKIAIASAAATSILMVACASSPYVPGVGAVSPVDLVEGALADGEHVVEFKGNSRTRSRRAQDFALLRAAELAIGEGAPFLVVRSWSDLSHWESHDTVDAALPTGGSTQRTFIPHHRLRIVLVDRESAGEHLFLVDAAETAARLCAEYELSFEGLCDVAEPVEPCEGGGQP